MKEQVANAHFIPTRVLLQGGTPATLEKIAVSLGIKYETIPPAWKLLQYASSLDEYLLSQPDPVSGELEGWPSRSDFNPRALQFRKKHQDGTNVRLSRYTNPTTSILHFFIWRDGKRIEVDRDWGRYIALHAWGLNVLVYDHKRFLLAVPASASLPRLLARSLGLCSGYAPLFAPREKLTLPTPETWGYHLFKWIPPQIAETVATRLNQELISHEINFEF